MDLPYFQNWPYYSTRPHRSSKTRAPLLVVDGEMDRHWKADPMKVRIREIRLKFMDLPYFQNWPYYSTRPHRSSKTRAPLLVVDGAMDRH